MPPGFTFEASNPETFPVFVEGKKIGEATEFSIDKEIDMVSSKVGPMTAELSDEYEVGDRIVHGIDKEARITLDVIIRKKFISTLEVAYENNNKWTVVELKDVHVTQTSEGNRQFTEAIASDINTKTVNSLGPDTEKTGNIEMENGFEAVIYDGE